MTRSGWAGGHGTRVVVVGGGFGGLSAIRALRDADVEVTLIDQDTYSTFQPLLYQVATATLNPGDITSFLRSIRSQQRNVRFVNATVVNMDHASRTVTLADGKVVGYDYLIIASGVTVNYFGVPGAAEHSMPLYTRTQALALRDEIFGRLEDAATYGQDRELRVVVVGGGATGVETAGALAELRNNHMPVTYPELDPRQTHVTLVEMLPTVLSPFQQNLRDYTTRSLERRGVDVRLNTPVNEVTGDGVRLGDGTFLPAGIVVWASGVTAPEVVGEWDVPQGRGGRVRVDDHLRVQGLDRVFAVGDIAVEDGERALPQLAQPAMQGGRYVAKLLEAELRGDTVDRFTYRDKGTLATIGRGSAVAQIPGVPPLRGFVAWVVWIVVHVFYLLGNRNRLVTMVNLGARYIFWHRSHHAIVGDIPRRTGSSERQQAE